MSIFSDFMTTLTGYVTLIVRTLYHSTLYSPKLKLILAIIIIIFLN